MAEAFAQKLEWKREITPFFILASLYLIRALAIGFITAGSPLILLFVFTCAYLVRMELFTCAADGIQKGGCQIGSQIASTYHYYLHNVQKY